METGWTKSSLCKGTCEPSCLNVICKSEPAVCSRGCTYGISVLHRSMVGLTSLWSGSGEDWFVGDRWRPSEPPASFSSSSCCSCRNSSCRGGRRDQANCGDFLWCEIFAWLCYGLSVQCFWQLKQIFHDTLLSHVICNAVKSWRTYFVIPET